MKNIFILSCCLILFFKTECIKINRVIFACDKNSNYIEFWPIVSKVWKELIGAKPTLALIADKSVRLDESCGEVIRLDPIPGMPTSFYAQNIKLLLPAYFENDVCLISDFDTIPVNKKFFLDNLSNVPDDFFILSISNLYDNPNIKRFPVCYQVGKGKLFKEIFFIRNLNEIPEIIKFWYGQKIGPLTDEVILYKYLNKWRYFKNKVKKNIYKYDQRVDRSNWSFFKYSANLVKQIKKDFFIDIQCPMPYHKNKKDIDYIINIFKQY